VAGLPAERPDHRAAQTVEPPAPDARREVSAGGVVYREQGAERRFLLIRDGYRNWGFPKGHLEADEDAAAAAVREVGEETGLTAVVMEGALDTIAWHFRSRGVVVHKTCHFFLMRADHGEPVPQAAEGITECRWVTYDIALGMLAYANARDVLQSAVARLGEP
jgi:8-oxo-dGTP pyrophosphatase MutT (NUDIX family)